MRLRVHLDLESSPPRARLFIRELRVSLLPVRCGCSAGADATLRRVGLRRSLLRLARQDQVLEEERGELGAAGQP